jgi:iron complex outermembrane receptor protein
MKKLSGSALLALTTGAFALAALPAGVAMAQSGANDQIEEIVTIGTRRKDRTALDTTVPMDVFNLEELDSVASDDLIDVMKTLVPSFNVGREPISDGGSFVRPPQMRGLDSDKTLVLINGKRRHRAALVQLGGFGSHGPDLATIPSMALRSVEVLRDGASALYGSDAIAGVLNFNLRNASEGGEIRIQTGRYNEDNEASQLFAGNFGVPLGEDGFLNMTMEYSQAEPTSRGQNYSGTIGGSGQRPIDAAGVVQLNVDHDMNPATASQTRYGPDALTEIFNPAGALISIINGSDGIADDTDTRYADNLQFAEVSDSELVQVWGEPERDAIRTFINAGFNLTDTTQVYGWYNYSDSNSNGSFFHRRPGVGQLSLLRTPDGEIYNPRSRYPSGFTPRFAGNVIDQSLTGGIKGELDSGLTWDVGARWGENKINYNIFNTLNPSLGPQSPTNFRPGNLITDEVAFNADFAIPLEVGFAEDLSLAFGFEYRDEGYTIEQGGAASYTAGPYAAQDPWNFETTQAEVDADPLDAITSIGCRIPGQESATALCQAGDPINNAVAVGSNGFPGYGPAFTSDFSRDSWAIYGDLEGDLTEDLLVTLAGRYEDFSDFGDNFSGRIAARYLVNDMVTVRGSFGTGFRAPTPGQLSTTNVSTRIADDGTPVAEGVFPASHPASLFFGSAPLDAETSTQYTLGVALTPVENLSVTVDYYSIDLDDRLILSSNFAVDAAAVTALTAAGVLGANTIAQVSFFTNDISTSTQGIDVVATYNLESGAGLTTFSVSANWNDTEVTDIPVHTVNGVAGIPFLNAEDKFDEEEGLPGFRSVLNLRHSFDNDIQLNVRGNYYGEHKNTNDSSLATTQTFDSLLQVDFDVTWDFSDRYTLTFGGNNVFDSLPDPGLFEAGSGRIYRSDTVSDWQGPFYYVRAAVKWD